MWTLAEETCEVQRQWERAATVRWLRFSAFNQWALPYLAASCYLQWLFRVHSRGTTSSLTHVRPFRGDPHTPPKNPTLILAARRYSVKSKQEVANKEMPQRSPAPTWAGKSATAWSTTGRNSHLLLLLLLLIILLLFLLLLTLTLFILLLLFILLFLHVILLILLLLIHLLLLLLCFY